ncbi:putative zinc metalloprotease [Encephalitozoon intestinalis ATCC 50506]|uniref:Zinc metalloprotease n=1 Tax=Encephalitozoon intestinalis (strain ATCC 50506) TaxID=876142 RepID=E0S704_ENCIT|nr:putative zinc metalloprotease [Encephalitozoon intestinalis ATCC 50506]ADM11590.1 putative zinc metalloprotease [Encephalitozoon intestinalis ATCC 50506]UTX45308.1 zinc metalloprotease [Encephalitozoon intestinalis]
MCRKTKGVFLLFFSVRLGIMLWEVRFQHLYSSYLERGLPWFKPDTLTGKMATDGRLFGDAQLKASNLRLKSLYKEMKALVLYMGVVFLIFNNKIRSKAIRLLGFLWIPNSEVMFLLLLISTITFIEKLCGVGLTLVEGTCSVRYIEYPFNMVVLFLVELPLTICLIIKLFELLRKKTMATFYAAFVISNLFNTFWNARIDKNRLTKVPLEKFPSKLQAMLKSEGLEESIYKVKGTQEKKNASLIGFSSFKRIEITGDFDKDPKKLYPVLFHEIGHSIDNIILKKKIIIHIIVGCEALAFWLIYVKGSKAFGFSDITSESFVLIILAMYLVLGRTLILIPLNMYVQRSELFADEIALANGHGKELSQTLFDMALEHSTVIDTTYLFNAIASLHPIVRERIDRCGSLLQK